MQPLPKHCAEGPKVHQLVALKALFLSRHWGHRPRPAGRLEGVAVSLTGDLLGDHGCYLLRNEEKMAGRNGISGCCQAPASELGYVGVKNSNTGRIWPSNLSSAPHAYQRLNVEGLNPHNYSTQQKVDLH